MAASGGSGGARVVRPGQAVVTMDDDRIGTVGEILGDYFTVRRGLFRGDLYVPLEDTRDIRPDAVYLNATAAEVDLKGWEEPPLHPEHRGGGPTRP